MKERLGGPQFGSNEDIIAKVNAYFEELEQSYSSEKIQKTEVYPPERWWCRKIKSILHVCI